MDLSANNQSKKFYAVLKKGGGEWSLMTEKNRYYRQ